MSAELDRGSNAVLAAGVDEDRGIMAFAERAEDDVEVYAATLNGERLVLVATVPSRSFQGLLQGPSGALLLFDGEAFQRVGRDGAWVYRLNPGNLTRLVATSGSTVVLTDRERRVAQALDLATGRYTPTFWHEWPITGAAIGDGEKRLVTNAGNLIPRMGSRLG